MPPSGFSPLTAKCLSNFIGGCQRDLDIEVTEGKHPNREAGRVFEISQIKKALLSVSDPLKKAVLELVLAAYELDLSASQVEGIVSHMHITSEGNLIEK